MSDGMAILLVVIIFAAIVTIIIMELKLRKIKKNGDNYMNNKWRAAEEMAKRDHKRIVDGLYEKYPSLHITNPRPKHDQTPR